jgi:5-formyltetrahydrofolate cyclo-ligase
MARDFADKGAARQWVWDRLVAEGVARFPFPPHRRIPNFAGAEVAAARLFNIEPWKSAKAIKVNSDSPQRPLRAEALRRGITVFVPSPRLRSGFKKLDPRRIPPDKIDEAASLSRGDRWSEEVALVNMPGLDAIVCGSVAVTRDGRRCGKGELGGAPVVSAARSQDQDSNPRRHTRKSYGLQGAPPPSGPRRITGPWWGARLWPGSSESVPPDYTPRFCWWGMW